MAGITKSFPGVRALDGVSFDVRAGEVHALVGENGAGKSTLMKILAGAYRADGGTIEIDGNPVTIDGPKDAERLGIGMIYQEFNLVPDLGVIENVVLGIEPVRGLFLDAKAAAARATAALTELGINLPLDRVARRLSVAEQQLTEIAKALVRHARLIVMDEPTAALTDRETDALFALIRKLKAENVAFVYISHRLEELPRIADRITVIRDGRGIETRAAADMPPDDLIRLMVGRALEAHFPDLPPVAPDAPVRLAVRDLQAQQILGEQDAENLIAVLADDRKAGMTRLDHELDQFIGRLVALDEHHLGAGHHDVPHLHVGHREDALEHDQRIAVEQPALARLAQILDQLGEVARLARHRLRDAL